MMFDGSSIEGFVRIEESDMYLYPDLSTWMIFPWESEHGKVARLICDIYNPDGTPFAGDPRGNLKRALADMVVIAKMKAPKNKNGMRNNDCSEIITKF